MKKWIMNTIRKVENGALGFDNEGYDLENCINHKVSGCNLVVYFKEKEFQPDEANGLDDLYNYDKVVAYETNGEFVEL